MKGERERVEREKMRPEKRSEGESRREENRWEGERPSMDGFA